MIFTKIVQETIHKIETQAITIDKEIIPNLLTGIITAIQIHNIDIEVTYQSIKDNLTKYKQLKNQLQTQLVSLIQETPNYKKNHISCESTDSESDTNNIISVNMITVENDYEPIIYEQPFSSHIYENHLEFLHDCYTRPLNNIPNTQEVKEINTVTKPDEKDKVQCSSTNHIYQNIQKKQPREKIWTIPFLLESPKNKELQPPDLEIDFLIDSGAESNTINIPTWNEIKTLHPNLILMKTASKLATAQGSTLINHGKIQLFLVPTRTMEQHKILTKPFKQTFHLADIKHNIIGIPFLTKNIPTKNILNTKIHIKDKYSRMKNTALTFFQRLNKQPPFFSNFYPI